MNPTSGAAVEFEREDSEEQRLIEKIHEEMRQINTITTRIYNNKSVIDSPNAMEKCIIQNEAHSAILIQQKTEGFANELELPFENEKLHLNSEIDHLCKDISKSLKLIENSQQELKRYNHFISNQEVILGAAKNNQENLCKKSDVIERNIRQRFKVERMELKTIVSTLFPDNLDLHDLIAKVIDHYFSEGPEKYLKLDNDDCVVEQIELLISSKIFERNPHAPLEIKMAELL